MGFHVNANALIKTLQQAYETKTQAAVRMYAMQGAQKFENYAKINRQWTDRTGRARQSLKGYIETTPNVTYINIAHGVYYGIYLELCNERKYAILQKTVDANAQEVLQGFEELLNYIF